MLLAAQTYTAEQLHAAGGIHRLGTLDDAVAWAHELSRLAPLTIAGHKLGLEHAASNPAVDDDFEAARSRGVGERRRRGGPDRLPRQAPPELHRPLTTIGSEPCSEVRREQPVDVLEEEVQHDHERDDPDQQADPVTLRLPAQQVRPDADRRQQQPPQCHLAVGAGVAEPSLGERVGDPVVDLLVVEFGWALIVGSSGPMDAVPSAGVSSAGASSTSAVSGSTTVFDGSDRRRRRLVERTSVVDRRLGDDCPVEPSGSSSAKMMMRSRAVYFGWHDVSVSVALVGSVVAITW